jgi:hypothetical protein
MLKTIVYTALGVMLMSVISLHAVDNQDVAKGPKQFVSKEGDYSIQIPEQWELAKDQMGADFIAVAPPLDPNDLFRENLNVISAKFEFPISKEEYYSLNVKSLNDLLTDFDLELTEDVHLGGTDARKLIFTHRVGIVNVRVVQYLILNHQKAIVISFTADILEYPKIKDQFDKIAATFKIENS